MPNTIKLPTVSPYKLVLENYTQSSRYHTKHFDDSLFQYQNYQWQQGTKYFQPVQNNDSIYLQLVSNYGPVSARLIDCNRSVIATGVINVIPTNYYVNPDVVYGITIDISSVPDGVYFINVLVGSGGAETSLIGEPLEIKADHPNTILFEYNNTTNNFGAVFQNGEVFSLRAEAGLADFQPGSNDTVYEDQKADLVMLYSQAFRTWKLVMGGAQGFPDYMADRINRILGCDTILFDGKRFTKTAGAKLERNGDRYFAKAGWSIEVREAFARDGATIENNQPLENSVAVIYVVDPQLFGKTSDVNIIKVQ
jgi:hypothetical protein